MKAQKHITRNNSPGFTLVELVIVIAIIGILAAIMIPSLLNYIRKANKRADVTTAASIGKCMIAYLTLYPEHWGDIHTNEKSPVTHWVEAEDAMGNYESYYIRVFMKINGNKNAIAGSEKYTGTEWSAGFDSQDLKDLAKRFTEECRQNITGGSTAKGGFLLPMKVYSHNDPKYPAKKKTDRWLMTVRYDNVKKKDTETIEIWAGWSECSSNRNNSNYYIYGGSANGPTYRLWPNPDREYVTGATY